MSLLLITRLSTAAVLTAAAIVSPAAAQLASRRTEPPGADVPGRLGAITAAQPLVSALPQWRVPALTPYVNLFSGGLFLRYSVLAGPAIGHDWDLSFFYNSTRATELSTLGRGWRHSYDIALLVNTPPGSITVRWGDGRRDVFSPAPGGWAGPASLEGRTIVNIPGGYRLATKHGDRHEFNTVGQLLRLVDRHANTTTLAYASGRLATITDPTGRMVSFTYNGSGRIISISGLLAQTMTLGYTVDRLASVSEVEGFPFTFGYDASLRLVRITDAQGRATHVGYYGSLAAVNWVRAVGARREYFFDSATRRTVVRDSVSATETRQLTYAFNVDGTTARVIQPSIGEWTNTYDGSNLSLLSHTDPNGHTWTQSHNAVGDLLTLTSPLSETWTWTYDPTYHLPATLLEPGGTALWQWNRNGTGDATQLVDPNTNSWMMTYTPQGQLQSVTDPNLNTMNYAYDGYGRLSTVQDPATYQRQATWDDRGHLLSFTDQQFNTWNVVRDGRDGVSQVDLPGGGSWTFEWWPDGKQKSQADPDLDRTQYAYDALDRLVRTVRDPDDTTTFERDGAGKVRVVTDGEGSQTETQRDGAGRTTERKDPNGGTTEYQYDGLDRRVVTTPTHDNVDEKHDARHRLIERASGPDTTRYEYDAMSRLVRARRRNGTFVPIEYRYLRDLSGRLTRKETVHLGRIVDFTIDPGGRVTRMDDNLQPDPWEYGFNSRDLIESLNIAFLVQLYASHSSRGEPTSTYVTPPGASISQNFNPLGRVSSTNLSGPSFFGYWNPTWSPGGNLTYLNAYSPAAGYTTMNATHDLAHRVLTEDHGALGAFAYAYDRMGNRISKNGPAGFESYTSDDAHRLLTAGAVTQTWNANGDVLTSGWPGYPIAYAYRPDRSLASVSAGGITWQVVPGPHGEIAAFVAPGNDTTWIDSDQGPAGLLRRAAFPARFSAPSEEYAHVPPAGGSPRFRRTAGGTEVLMPGPFGTSEVVNGSGTVSSRYSTVFGELLAQTGAPYASPGFHDMDVVREPHGPLLRGVSDGLSALPQDVAYLPRIGSLQRDLELGPDFMCNVGIWPPPGYELDKDGNLVEKPLLWTWPFPLQDPEPPPLPSGDATVTVDDLLRVILPWGGLPERDPTWWQFEDLRCRMGGWDLQPVPLGRCTEGEKDIPWPWPTPTPKPTPSPEGEEY